MDPCTFAADPECKDSRKPSTRKVPSRLEDSLYHEDALHHGINFEVILPLP